MKKYKHVFKSLRIGNIEIRNRIEVPPMLSCLSTQDGFVTREMIEFYQAFARGGAGIVTIGDTAVDSDYAPGHHMQFAIGDDRAINGLNKLAEAIQKYGSVISIELNHTGKLGSPRVLGGKLPIGPSVVKDKVIEMDQALIDQVVDNFANAAYRCMVAGFNMVMVHGAHGNLLGQFSSPHVNFRNDKYGGSLENRARFAMEILTAIRKKVGNQLAIEYRISGDEIVPDGMHLPETIEFIRMIEDKIDLVHVSLGLVSEVEAAPFVAQPTYFPHAFNAHRAEAIRKAVNIPVTCVGSVPDIAMAEQIIADGKADVVAMGRPHLADPDIVNKTLRGEETDIRPCVRCNICGGRPARFLPVRCAINPVAGREVEYKCISPAVRKRKVVIVGGGPAGMQAALTAADRGHEVIIFEKEAELGGALRYAAAPSIKADMKKYLNWLVNKARQAPMDIRMETVATAHEIRSVNPDVLILAVGADPLIPDIPGIRNRNVVWAGDVDMDKAETGQNVVVAGAGLTGCETAIHIRDKGKDVTIIEMLDETAIACDASNTARLKLLSIMKEKEIAIKCETILIRVSDDSAVVADNQGNRAEITANTIVLAIGSVARKDTVKELQDVAPEVYTIGDCVSPRSLMTAIHEGFAITAEL